jgi:AcrR family transcriptional regulator
MATTRSQPGASSGSAGPQGAENADRRSLILQAAANSFAEVGYQGTGLADICKGAGIAKPTVYHHFPSKAAILYELLHDYMALLTAAAEAPERRQLSPPDRLLELMRDMLGSLDTHRGQVRLFYDNAADVLPEPLRETIAEQRLAYSRHVEHVLLAGRDADVFAFDDARMTRLSIFALCGWPYNWYHPGGDVSTDDIALHAWNLVVSGIRA